MIRAPSRHLCAARPRRLPFAMKPSLGALLGLALLASAAASRADVQLYSAATLDTLWNNAVSNQPLTSLTPDQFKASLGPGTSPAPTPVPTPCPRGGCGKTPLSPTTVQQPVYFQVVDIAPHLEAELVGRQVALATYLTKSELYQPDGINAATQNGDSLANFHIEKATSDEKTLAISLRRYAAKVELFLIAMMRYYSVDTIGEKCSKISEANDLLGQIAAAKIEVDGIRARPGNTLQLETRFAALEALQIDVAQRYSNDIKAATACLVSPALSRKANLAAAANHLESSLNSDLSTNGTVKTTLEAINQVQQSLADLQSTVSLIDPHTNSLLELELKASNATSNFNMVRSDALAVQAKVLQMEQTVDVGAIANLGGMTSDQLRSIGSLGQLDTAVTTMSGTLTSYLDLLTQLPATLSAQDPGKTLAPCSGISPTFLSSTSPDIKPVTDCLTALKALVDAAGLQTLFQLEMTEFSSKVVTLSPEIIKDRSGR